MEVYFFVSALCYSSFSYILFLSLRCTDIPFLFCKRTENETGREKDSGKREREANSGPDRAKLEFGETFSSRLHPFSKERLLKRKKRTTGQEDTEERMPGSLGRFALLTLVLALLTVFGVRSSESQGCGCWVSVEKGSSTGNGTEANPFKSLGAALSSLQETQWKPFTRVTSKYHSRSKSASESLTVVCNRYHRCTELVH